MNKITRLGWDKEEERGREKRALQYTRGKV